MSPAPGLLSLAATFAAGALVPLFAFAVAALKLYRLGRASGYEAGRRAEADAINAALAELHAAQREAAAREFGFSGPEESPVEPR